MIFAGLRFQLWQALALASVALFAACLWFRADAEAARRNVSELRRELSARETERAAVDASRAVADAGRDDIERLLNRYMREAAHAPIAEDCRSDPAILRAYGAIERMRDAHADALRGAGVGDIQARAVPGADGKPRY